MAQSKRSARDRYTPGANPQSSSTANCSVPLFACASLDLHVGCHAPQRAESAGSYAAMARAFACVAVRPSAWQGVLA